MKRREFGKYIVADPNVCHQRYCTVVLRVDRGGCAVPARQVFARPLCGRSADCATGERGGTLDRAVGLSRWPGVFSGHRSSVAEESPLQWRRHLRRGSQLRENEIDPTFEENVPAALYLIDQVIAVPTFAAR